MKRYRGINYGQKPASYWEESNVLQAVLSDVKGARRRELIRSAFQDGEIDDLDEELLESEFSGNSRTLWERLSPEHMGGEYLPDNKPGEVEIARIELQSTTFDVISIRARMNDGEIQYSIEDEYESVFTQPFDSTSEPLKLRELIEFIEGSEQEDCDYSGGLAICFNEMNAEYKDRSDLVDFTTVDSGFYPQLSQHFAKVHRDWARA